jgi:hypothetical protein
MASTLVTLKTQLRSLLATALAADTAVQVLYAYPPDPSGTPDIVCLGNATADVEIPTMVAGRKRRDESYTLTVVVEHVGEGESQETADTRCLVLFGKVEDALADDPNLAIGSTIFWAQLAGWEQVGGYTDTGHGCRIEAQVQVRARLT